MKFYDAGFAFHPLAVRLFILERGGLSLDVQQVNLFEFENHKPPYSTEINPRREEVPALVLDDGTILADTVAICEYLDEIAHGGQSLYGTTPEERAQTRMMLRRGDLELAQPIMAWWRNDPDTIKYYKGTRLPIPEARLIQKIQINQHLNSWDLELEGKDFLCGHRFSAADIFLWGTLKLIPDTEWVYDPSRKNFMGWWQRMEARDKSKEALTIFGPRVDV
ncbi:glutathione S-transferase domain-containing protein [Xylogone sp. PMI_703]|nr:glutathione S-transferase domain-containing protein [Xylogone sp. PMI_703]